MIVGITDSRLSQVAYDYNTQVAKADQTIEKLVANMIIGETELPINRTSGNRNFCIYHSFGGVKDCNFQFLRDKAQGQQWQMATQAKQSIGQTML